MLILSFLFSLSFLRESARIEQVDPASYWQAQIDGLQTEEEKEKSF